MANLGRFILYALAGLALPMFFAGLAALINGSHFLGAALIAVSILAAPIWLRLRGTFR